MALSRQCVIVPLPREDAKTVHFPSKQGLLVCTARACERAAKRLPRPQAALRIEGTHAIYLG